MSTQLTPRQLADIDGARALIEANLRGPEALAAYITQHGHPTEPGDYAAPFGFAHVTIENLLDIIDGLTGGAS